MRFEVKGLRNKEGVTALYLEATSENDALLQAKGQGYAILSIRQKESFSGWLLKRRTRFPLVLFSQELLSLLDAGLSLIEAMEALSEKEQRGETQKILEQIIAHLYEGQSLSAALGQFPAVFPALYVATVRASERTGDLGQALTRYVAYQTQLDAVRKKIVGASIYPVLLMVVGGLVLLFLMGYVVPKFSKIYEGTGTNLPWLSSLLLSWGSLLDENGAGVALGLSALAAGTGYGLSRSSARRWLAAKLWQIPALGERMRLYQLARCYRTMGMLLHGGIPIVTAMEMVAGLLQPALRGKLGLAGKGIREGLSISQAMEANGLTTPVALRMLRVGERTGKMGEMMERIAGFYDEEMARWVEWFTRLFEPILMALIGLVIGGIVILMYMPIFDLAGSIQ